MSLIKVSFSMYGRKIIHHLIKADTISTLKEKGFVYLFNSFLLLNFSEFFRLKPKKNLVSKLKILQE
jgi:hypothetical protein